MHVIHLRCWCAVLQVHLGTVQLGNAGVISSIRCLQPYTISWSNVPDYMHPADFHKLAQAVSAPSDTVHFMHRYGPARRWRQILLCNAQMWQL